MSLSVSTRAVALMLVIAPAKAAYEEIAILEALDKITGRVFTLEAAIGSEVEFGRLRINPYKCYKSPPEQPPESIAFLEIRETTPNQEIKRVFAGWMFASSPGLSTLEHPIYDIVVLDCYSPTPSTGTPPVTIESLPPTASNE